jgi:DNA polymerase-3 subunit delta
MTPAEAIAEAQAHELRPVYLVMGEERLLSAEVLTALKDAALEGATPGLNEDHFVAGEAHVDAVISTARTQPMFAKRRLVVVRQLERWEANKSKSNDPLTQLASYAADPNPSTTLLLAGGKLDKRRKLVSEAQKKGYLVACDALGQYELPRWIEQRARLRGNPLAPGVAELLAELSGPDLATVADALERVCLYAGAEAEVSEDTVAECVVRVRPTTVWELVDAVGRRDAGNALSCLGRVYDPHDRGLRLVGVLAWSARQMLRFESALRDGAAPPEAARRAGAPPFKAQKLAQQLKNLPRNDLERWLSTLAEVDLALKGGSKRPPQAVLEHAILELCRRPKGGRGVKQRRPRA